MAILPSLLYNMSTLVEVGEETEELRCSMDEMLEKGQVQQDSFLAVGGWLESCQGLGVSKG